MKNLLKLTLLLISIQLFSQVNTSCGNAISIPLNIGQYEQIETNTTNLADSINGACISVSATTYRNLWYSFVMPVNGNIKITNASSSEFFKFYDSCGGIEIGCAIGSNFIYSLTGGHTYYFRYSEYSVNAGTDNFRIEAFAAATNNDCATPLNITVPTNTYLLVAANTMGSTITSSLTSCESAYNVGWNWHALYYRFTMPVNGNIRITSVGAIEFLTLQDACGGTEIKCFNGNAYIYSLTAGQTYYLRYANTDFQAGENSFRIQAFEIALNDICANPENIVVPTNTFLEVTANTSESTISNITASCENVNDTYLDLWYSFAMPVNGNIRITYANNQEFFTLYDACNGTEIKCFNNTSYMYSLTAGQTYYLRYSNTEYWSGNQTFRIQAFETALNDTCANPENIVVPTNTFLEVTANTSKSTISNVSSTCENVNNTYLDLWYSFTMPVNGNIRITYANNQEHFTLFDACNGTEIKCFNNTSYIYSLTAGQTYYLRYANEEYWSDNHTFRIQAFETALNDTCTTPENIIVPTNTFLEVTANTSKSTISNVSSTCKNVNDTYLDLWYSFTMPVNGNIRITYANNQEYFTLYDACNGTEIKCFNNTSYIYSLTAGQTYYLQYSNTEYWSDNHTFRIQAFETALNDTCANAENIVVTTANYTEVVTNTSKSTLSNTTTNCENINDSWLDLWYTFTMPVNGNLLISYANNQEYFTLYDACNGTEIDCFNGNNTLFALSSATTYTLRYSKSEYWSGSDNFRLQVIETAANDLCLNAINLNVGIYDEFSETKTLFGATLSASPLPPTNCGANNTDNDVWFTVQVPSSGKLTIETNQVTSSNLNDTILQLFENSCGNFTEVDCDDNSGNGYFSKISVSGRIPTEILYVRLVENGNNIADYYNIFAYDNVCISKTIWNGTTWSNGIPTTTSIAEFDGNYNTDTTSLDMCICKINTGKTVTIQDGKYLNLSDDLINNGSLILENQASFVQTNENATIIGSGNFTTKIDTNPLSDSRYTYFSSPIENANISVFSSWAQTNKIYKFNGTSQNWETIGSSNLMIPGKGYIVRPPNPVVYNTPSTGTATSFVGSTNFYGKFNNGNITQNITFNIGGIDDDNELIGNPYPSAIETVTLFTDNPRANAFYFWTHDRAETAGTWIDDYAIYNGTGYTSGNALTPAPTYIASGQGFFVVGNSGVDPNPQITFKNSQRRKNQNNQFLRPPNNDLDKIWLNLSNSSSDNNSQILIGFNPICTDEFDNQYDATRFNSGSALSFYSSGIGANAQKLAIQTRGLLTTDDEIIPLGFEISDANLSSLTISIDHFENLTNTDVLLNDLLLNTTHDLKQSVYSFTQTQLGDINNRFELLFRQNTLNTNQNSLVSDKLIITEVDNYLNIKTTKNKIITKVNIYNILGKEIVSLNDNKIAYKLKTENLNQGDILFIKVALENESILNSKFIKVK